MNIGRIDKLTSTYSVRIPEILDEHLKRLPSSEKKRLNEELLVVMARHVHDSQFSPDIYLCSESVQVYLEDLADIVNKGRDDAQD